MPARPAFPFAHALVAVLLSGATTLAGVAAAAPYNPSALPAPALAQVGDICRGVMGVKPGFSLYDACVESLSGSAARLQRAAVRQAARKACLSRGQGPDLTRCELDTAARATPAADPVAAPPAQPAGSFLRASSPEARSREQQACGRLGYDPTSGGFAACVASLDSALYAADHPQP